MTAIAPRRRKRTTEEVRAAFLMRLDDLGARPSEDFTWAGADAPVRVICAAGHLCTPRPGNVIRGHGVCGACAGNDWRAAEQRFLALLATWGASPADDYAWQGSKTLVDVVCPNGHRVSVEPGRLPVVSQPCPTCAGRTAEALEGRFLDRLEVLGAEVGPGYVWVNTRTKYDVICSAGHACVVTANQLDDTRRTSVCRICAGQSSEAAEAAFLSRLSQLGARPVDGYRWKNNKTPVAVICAGGHLCAPVPNSVLSGQGVCVRCAGKSTDDARASFLRRLDELKARPAADATWRGAKVPFRVVCANGHPCAPRPASVQQGQGVCAQCAQRYDRVYVAKHAASGAGKVGVASGVGRLNHLQRLGYEIVAQWSTDHALHIERDILDLVRSFGAPVMADAPRDGRTETFPVDQIEWVLGELDVWCGAENRLWTDDHEPLPGAAYAQQWTPERV